MPRSLRQSKILELISANEIEKQEELVALLRENNFDITQATVSRDIKELGLIKVLSENKKYKYAYIDSNEQPATNKYVNIFKECFVSIKSFENTLFIRTIKSLGSAINANLDKLGLENFSGSTCGDDTVVIYFDDAIKANEALSALNNIIYS